MLYFDELKNRYILSGRLISEAGLHVGTGVASATTDAPFILQQGAPFVPGSSLRGSLRSTVERILRSLGVGDRICTLFERTAADCMSGKKQEEQDKEHEKGALRFCAVCRLFGSTGMASKLKIGDAIQIAKEAKMPVRRDGVGLNRDTETAQEAIKFDYEVLDRGCVFKFPIQLENAQRSDFALLYIVLCELRSGIYIGGKKAAGLGRVRLQDEYEIEYFDEDRGYKLKDYLETGMKRERQKPFEEWLKDQFQKFLKEELGHADASRK
jgi:CRISPR-associated protein Csm3